MDQNCNRRVSRRLIEKGITSCEQNDTSAKKQLKTGRKTKANAKTVKLKENDKINTNSGNESSSPSIDGSQRKYGLRKLAPINWRERLDTRHLTSDQKTDKIKDKCFVKSDNKANPKLNNKVNKDKKIKVIKVNGKININESSNEKKTRKRKITHSLNGGFDTTSEDRDLEHNDSEMESSDLSNVKPNVSLNGTSDVSDQLIQQESTDPPPVQLNISYFEFLERSLNSPSVPSFSFKTDTVMKLLLQKSKSKSQSMSKTNVKQTIRSNNRRKLYSCGYDLCDSKWCQNDH